MKFLPITRIYIFTLTFLISGSSIAAEELTVNLDHEIVKITADFNGTDVLFFGVAPDKGDVVVVIRGPLNDEIVRRKERIMGVWVNSDQVIMDQVPSFYAMASNRPLDAFMPPGVAAIHQIGLENILIEPRKNDPQVKNPDAFRLALIRNKVQQGLYTWDPEDLTFLGNRLFRTKIKFPANVSVGEFGVDVYLIRKGELIAQKTSLLSVRKFGIESQEYDFAQNKSLIYCILAILIAGLAGWLANSAFRKS